MRVQMIISVLRELILLALFWAGGGIVQAVLAHFKPIWTGMLLPAAYFLAVLSQIVQALRVTDVQRIPDYYRVAVHIFPSVLFAVVYATFRYYWQYRDIYYNRRKDGEKG